MNTVKPMYKWSDIPWRKLEKNIYKLQKRIYKASSRGNVKLVRRLQKLLIKSWSAKCLAVRRVTQDNQGRKTAGVDGVKSLSPKQRLTLTNKLTLGTKVAPTRRVWIPKPGKQEKRPLGIPTIKDRAMQGLVKLALEPEWEAKFEPNSYGFRPGRSCHDAITAIFGSIKQKSKYVFDADISQCFDCINHNKLLEKLNTYPTLRKQIRAWLKAGVMDGIELKPTLHGTPQGGVLSPLLANIALHGMENVIKDLVVQYRILSPTGRPLNTKDKRQSVNLIRYADDFVIFHENINILNKYIEVITQWLNDMGLEIKASKTRTTHTLMHYKKEKPGFDFLGFHIRQFKSGKYRSAKYKGNILGFKTIISPSKNSASEHYQKIAEIIRKHKSKRQAALIDNLNPIIRGWCNYFAIASSSKVFRRLKNITFWKLWKWGKKRHQNKGRKFVKNKYFHHVGNKNWVFATKISNNELFTLKLHDEFTFNDKYIKVKGNASPYNGNLIYWSTRMGKNPEMPKRTASLLKKQKGKCTHCGLTFKDGDLIELDHIIPKSKGGKDEYKNWQLLHRHCHDEKTKTDGSLERSGNKTDCNSVIPKQLSIIPSNYKWVEDMLVMTY
ncbi:group II intron reverse transcriptase/maturase [Crocosphaera chwakensis]|uniref:RNA-directed DNA polymerase n=1 Tax=Crocosphaera chwakensis CCY0110 TaxID=391612 RepID=A3IK29_9CHRO|nr:group II intron reverse transcriptase/maturase [Crocosphaera chwakensis]EAZ93018.1 RNA-directed DNA polymerase [Crocosphaera chwakensis CCY0110]